MAAQLRIEPDKRYTVWRKHPHSGRYVLERSYYGTYFEGEGKMYLSSSEFCVTAEGREPNPSLNRCGGEITSGPGKAFGRCVRCGTRDYEAYEGDRCVAPTKKATRKKNSSKKKSSRKKNPKKSSVSVRSLVAKALK